MLKRSIYSLLFCCLGLGYAPTLTAAINTAIRVNQVGFLPNNTKGFSVLGSLSGNFEICVSPSGSVAYTGSFPAPMVNADTNETLTLGDFSPLTPTGSFYINITGTGQSPAFSISPSVYNNPFWVEMMGYFIRRCGNIAPSFTWNGLNYSHAACHLNDADEYYVDGGVNTVKTGTGGWHDAGDYGKYTVNMAFALTQLLQAWEWHKAVLSQWSLPIPEDGGPYPDYLAELKYALDWMLEMQAPDGGAYHKMTGLAFEPFGILPSTDTTTRYQTPESSAATAEFCAVMSMAGRLYAPYNGGAYAAQCLSAAATAYTWLQANPAEVFGDANVDLGFTTGAYEDPPGTYPAGSGIDDDPDHRVHADAEYWDSTGDTTALADFETRELPANDPDQVSLYWDWGEHLYGKRGPKNNGIFTYLLSTRSGRSSTIVSNLQNALLSQADGIVATSRAHGYARPLGDIYHWGSNGTTGRQAMLLDCANQISPSPAYMNTALGALGYLYGRNYYSRSFVTGVGYSPPLNPHDELSAALDSTVPGHLVGGPGGHNETATDWTDTQADYYTNEIAINWDGGIVAALACFITAPALTPSATPSPCAACSATESPTRTPQETLTQTCTASPTPSASPLPSLTPTETPLPCGDAVVLRMDCGSVTDYTDSSGNVWDVDAGFVNGTAATSAATVTGTSDPLLYQTTRYGATLNYAFNLPDGNYQVVFLNSENSFAAAGDRVFNIALQGTTVETNYDIFTAAGGEHKATSLTFTASVTAGVLSIAATASVNNAQFAAIEITWLGSACSTPTPSFSPSPVFSPSPSFSRSASPSNTPSPSPTPSATASASPSATLTQTSSPSPTLSASPTGSASPSPSASPSAASSSTPSPSGSPTGTGSPTASASPTATGSPSPGASPTTTPSPTPGVPASPSPSPSLSVTEVFTPTFSATPSFSAIPSSSASPSGSFSPTEVSTGTRSPSPSATPDASPSLSASWTSSDTPSDTVSSSPTALPSRTPSPSATVSATASPSASPSAAPSLPTATPTATSTGTALVGATGTVTPPVLPSGGPGKGPFQIEQAAFAPQPISGAQVTLFVDLNGDADSVEFQLYSRAFTKMLALDLPGPWIGGWNARLLSLPTLPNGLYFVLLEARQGSTQNRLKKPLKMMVLR